MPVDAMKSYGTQTHFLDVTNNMADLQRSSTNPFDDSSDSDDGEEFHDCQQTLSKAHTLEQRSAPLSFGSSCIHVKQEDPALSFDRPLEQEGSEFFSPLENALMEIEDEAFHNAALHGSIATTRDRIQVSDPSPLLNHLDQNNQQIDGKILKSNSRSHLLAEEPRRVQWKDAVLRHLGHQEHETLVDFKLILVEDLGTASSWTLLLLPYLALIVCLLIETGLNLKVDGPFEARLTCFNNTDYSGVPSILTPSSPCSFPFELQDNNGILTHSDKGSGIMTFQFQTVMARGWAFDSSPISDIPPSSTVVRGDAVFNSLSTDSVALVARGMVVVSTVVLQRRKSSRQINDEEWNPVFISKPDHLSLACHPTEPALNASIHLLWNCTAPRIIDMLESMPATAVLTGSDLRIIVLYAVHDLPSPVWEEMGFTFVFADVDGANELFNSVNISSPLELVRKATSSSTYTIEHQSCLVATIEVVIRTFAVVITSIFIVFWWWSIRTAGREHCTEKATLWWESPWLLFPERYYILLLLFGLLMVQNPFLVAMAFFPDLYSDTRLHAAADAVLGIGVNLILFVYLCLFHGLRYHTAAVATRRTNHMRQVLHLRRAAKYVTEAVSMDDATDESISRYTADYYEQFGDTDGSGSSSAVRLQHDPCGSTCADFLIPKLFILILGVLSVVATAFTRFPASKNDSDSLLPSDLEIYEQLFIAGSFTQLGIMVVWVILIFQRVVGTGKKLRKEPFLRTRPAQLAYRILFAQVVLGALTLSVPFTIDFFRMIKQWKTGLNASVHSEGSSFESLLRASELDLLLRVLSGAARRFPYSGTAASVGPGRIFFATICILNTAVVFLPAHPLNETENDGAGGRLSEYGSLFQNGHGVDKGRHRKDKRVVVTLARYTHTWRVFPLPIVKDSGETQVQGESSFLLNFDLELDHSGREGRGVVVVGSYTPVFCVEIACWLNEASWQAYYDPNKCVADNEWAPGRMNLESLGLRLERVIQDETANIQAFIATNPLPRVDGEEDSIIVVSFRGSANASNVKTDFRARQVPLTERIVGDCGGPLFRVSADQIVVHDTDDHFWDMPTSDDVHLLPQGRLSKFSKAKRRAKAVLGSTPVTKSAFPCVHEGFQDAYGRIRKPLLKTIVLILQRQLRNVSTCARTHGDESKEPLVLPKIYVTGHSLGGSLAQLLALDLACNCELVLTKPGSSAHATLSSPSKGCLSPSASWDSEFPDNLKDGIVKRIVVQPPLAVYTFGQPRLGNPVFARLYKSRVPHTFRVAVEGDPVTTLPNVACCGGFYKHAGLEVVLDEAGTGNTLVGPTVVETLFRFHKVRTDISAHTLSRYRDCLESALESHELEEYYRSHGGGGSDYGTVPSAKQSIPQWMTQARSKQ